jgi:proline dehydrogenase
MKPLRSALLWASRNPKMERVVRSSRAMRPLVSRFMPGETLESAMQAVQTLQRDGVAVIMTYLGENVSSIAAADETLSEYRRLFAALKTSGADAHVSIKLTQFGWDLDKDLALERVRQCVRIAAENDTILAIDMEGSEYVESTVDAYEQLASEFRSVALCLQAYLHRTPDDLKRLRKLNPYIRLVKGAYREGSHVALQSRSEISARYRSLANELLRATPDGTRVAFGSHDVPLLENIRADARGLGVSDSAFEVQMLYGIQDRGRRYMTASGVKTRVLISYGKAWYPWFMRRLAEKPSNLFMIARNLFS